MLKDLPGSRTFRMPGAAAGNGWWSRLLAVGGGRGEIFDQAKSPPVGGLLRRNFGSATVYRIASANC